MGLIVGSLVIASFVHFSGAQTSSTIVSGIINSNTTWTMAGSPYMFNGTVVVNNGVTLIIPAGVTVNLNGYTFTNNALKPYVFASNASGIYFGFAGAPLLLGKSTQATATVAMATGEVAEMSIGSYALFIIQYLI